MNYTPIFTPGLTEEEKVAMINASGAAISLARQLGVDCSDVMKMAISCRNLL